MSDESPEHPRHLPIEGTHNFRDVGGYPTADGGTVRWRTLFRSDSLHALTDAGHQALLDLGIRSSIDLRGEREVAAAPSGLASSRAVRYESLGMGPSIRESPEPIRTLEGLNLYHLETGKPSIAAIVRTIAEPDALPAVINCTAGKDRTGLITGLLLSLVGVPRYHVIEDYLLTERYASAWLAELYEVRKQEGRDPDLAAWVTDYRAEVMERTLDHLDQRYGGAEGYVREIGLSDDAIGAVRSALVAPAS